MITPDEFRKLALRLQETVEQQHQGHPDFRVGGKVFATLGWPDTAWGMVKLPIEEQKTRVATQPGIFEPAPGAWGRRGSTKIRLAAAEIDLIENVLQVAWGNVAEKSHAKTQSRLRPISPFSYVGQVAPLIGFAQSFALFSGNFWFLSFLCALGRRS
jgi:hypothetical protein